MQLKSAKGRSIPDGKVGWLVTKFEEVSGFYIPLDYLSHLKNVGTWFAHPVLQTR